MDPKDRSRSALLVVIVCMILLALLAYLLPGTLAAFMFPGISRVGAALPVAS